MTRLITIISTILILSTLAVKVSAAGNATEIITAVGKSMAPDSRQIVYEVTGATADNGKIVVKGLISEATVADSLRKALAEAGIEYVDSLTVAGTDLWATPLISVACLRTRPSHAGEMASQAIMGMPLRVIEKRDGWTRVQTPDGYIAWVTNASIVSRTAREMAQWRHMPRSVVTAVYQTRAYNTPTASGLRDVVTDFVNGNIVCPTGRTESGRTEIATPDGRRGWVDSEAITPIEVWADQPFDAQKILDTAYSMEGTPYLWGGTSVKSLDCSGLAKVSYLSNGIILMRDASQQALTGTRIEATDWPACQAGDLLFFGNADTGRVTHVAIYDHDGNYVHSSGRVKRNSVDPKSPSYLTTPFLHAVRIAGNEGSNGITRAKNHPWYF